VRHAKFQRLHGQPGSGGRVPRARQRSAKVTPKPVPRQPRDLLQRTRPLQLTGNIAVAGAVTAASAPVREEHQAPGTLRHVQISLQRDRPRHNVDESLRAVHNSVRRALQG
jgi:hypothetical protein